MEYLEKLSIPEVLNINEIAVAMAEKRRKGMKDARK